MSSTILGQSSFARTAKDSFSAKAATLALKPGDGLTGGANMGEAVAGTKAPEFKWQWI